jgi:hypothetical protein
MVQADSPQIVLFTPTKVLSGSIFISTPEGRLLDELNGDFSEEPENRDEFLELTQVTIWHPDSTKENVSLCHVNKTAIQMAAISDDNLNRGVGAKPDHNFYPFIKKEALRVKIEMSGYRITGSIHRVSYQNVGHVLQERTKFMPLTHAEVSSLANGKRWYLPFVAVNKKQILFLNQ